MHNRWSTRAQKQFSGGRTFPTNDARSTGFPRHKRKKEKKSAHQSFIPYIKINSKRIIDSKVNTKLSFGEKNLRDLGLDIELLH